MDKNSAHLPAEETASEPSSLRAKQAQSRHRRLFNAALKVVGEAGYTETTISKITKRAGMAQGTFYNYFDLRQELFEKLLPTLGDELMEFLDRALVGSDDFVEKEERCLRGFFDFSREHPEFYRILTEAEVFVPNAHRAYVAKLADWYMKVFSEQANGGALVGYSDQEREVVAYILLAAHHYLTMRYTHWIGHSGRIPDWVVAAYMRFVGRAIGPQQAAAAGPLPTPARGSARKGRKSAAKEAAVQALRFVPQLVPRPYSENAAFVPQIDCRTTIRDDGLVKVELDLHPGLLNSRGAASGGFITTLAELAGAAAVCHDRQEVISVELVGLAATFVRPISEGTLVAVARRENSGRNIRFVDIRVLQDDEDGPLVAHISGTWRVLGD